MDYRLEKGILEKKMKMCVVAAWACSSASFLTDHTILMMMFRFIRGEHNDTADRGVCCRFTLTSVQILDLILSHQHLLCC